MKVNYDNMIIESFLFGEDSEAQAYFTKQKSRSKIFLQESYGDNHCVVKLVDSLSKEIKFCFGFSSETPPSNLNLLAPGQSNRFIIEIDCFMYFFSLVTGEMRSKIELLTPLIGIYLFGEKLLVLEEAGLKIVDTDGVISQEETTDLIEDFILTGDVLNLVTMDGGKHEIKLLP